METAAPLRLLIVDDHVLVRMGLRTLLDDIAAVEVVGEAGTVAEAVTAARELRPDIILMDVRLPDGSGVDACRQIRSARPATQVLMLTSYADDDAIFSAIVAGASGYLLKQARTEKLLEAIEVVGEGGSLLDPAVTQKVLERIRATADAPMQNQPPHQWRASLSAHEQRILPLIAEGKTNRQIAEALGLSEHTVKAHVSDLLGKLELRRRSEAAAFFARQADQPRD